MFPLVSVLMTCYNREKYIAEAIESVLASSYPDFELIIVDDRSVDSTVKIVRAYEQKDSRIKVYINEKNLGDYPNRNKAVSYAKGEYLMFVDSDDKLFPENMAKLVDLMTEAPDVHFGMVRHNCSEVSVMDTKEVIHHHFFKQPILKIGPGGTIINRSFFHRIKGYPEKYGPANDMYFNLKACCFTSVMFAPFEFVFYRIHEGQEINNSYSYLYNNYRYERDALAELPLQLSPKEKTWIRKKMRRRFFFNVIKYLIKTGNVGNTMQAIKKAEFTIRDALSGIFH